jgi:hypothetical protein
MKTKTNLIMNLTLMLVLLMSITSISAFGVGSIYTNENPLKLSPGESSDVLISLQNNEAVSLKGSILAGGDVAQFLDVSDVYNVPANGTINARIKVSVPARASVGKEYAITMSFSGVPGAQGGTVGFNTAIEKSFKVLVVEKPVAPAPETPAPAEGISLTWWILGIIAVIAVIAIIWFVVKNKGK